MGAWGDLQQGPIDRGTTLTKGYPLYIFGRSQDSSEGVNKRHSVVSFLTTNSTTNLHRKSGKLSPLDYSAPLRMHVTPEKACVVLPPHPRGTPKRWAEPTAMSTPKSPGGLSIVNDMRSVAATTSVSDWDFSHARGGNEWGGTGATAANTCE